MRIRSTFIVLLMLISTSLQAQFTTNLTVANPKALALGHAVTADPPSVDSIHFNPAGLARIQYRTWQFKMIAAQSVITSKTGEQQHSPAVREAYEAAYGKPFPTDPLANQSDTASDAMYMLPGLGLVEAPISLAPFGGFAVPDPDGDWVIATAIFSPVSSGMKRDKDKDPGAYQGYERALNRITYLSPTVAFQVNDKLAVGVGFGASWQGFGEKTKLRAAEQTLIFSDASAESLQNTGIDVEVLEAYAAVGDLHMEMEDAFSPSFHFGILYQPYPWLTFGLNYQSEAKADMEGDYKMTNSDGFLATTQLLQPVSGLFGLLDGAPLNAEKHEEGAVKSEWIHPQSIALGTSVQLFPSLKVNLDMRWVEYSKWEEIVFKYSNNIDWLTIASMLITSAQGYGVEDNADPNELRLPRNNQNVLSYSLGVEYQYDDDTVLRFGYEPRGSIVQDDYVDFFLPIGEATLYSFGIGHQIDPYSRFDLAVGYMASTYSANVNPVYENGEVVDFEGESHIANDTGPGEVIYNPYAYIPIEGKTTSYMISFSYETLF